MKSCYYDHTFSAALMRAVRALVAIAGVATTVLSLTCGTAFGQATYYWDSNGATAGFGTTTGTWGASTFWSASSAGTSATSGTTTTTSDEVNFGTATLNYGNATVSVAAGGVSVGRIVIGGNQTTGITLGGTGTAITIANGVTKSGSSGIFTLSSTAVLSGAQTWTNNSSTALNVNMSMVMSGTVTFGGSGIIAFDNNNTNLIRGTGGIIKNGSGQLNLGTGTGSHTFTGDITLNDGSIGFQTSSFLTGRNVTITGGYLGGRFNSGYTWTSGLGTGANQIQITGGTSGFSGEGSNTSTFQIGGALSSLKWGASGENGATGYFNPAVFVANGPDRTNVNGKGALNNGIDLNGSNRTFTSTQTTDGGLASGFTINGVVNTSTGTAGIVKTGVGNLILTATNTYNGGTTINAGSVTFDKRVAMPASGAVQVNDGATLGIYVNTTTGWNGGASNGGIAGLTAGLGGQAGSTVSFSGNPTISMEVNANVTESNSITNGGATNLALAKRGGSTLTLSGSNTFSGGISLLGGEVKVNNARALGTGIVTVNGGNFDNNSGGAITLATNNVFSIQNNFTFNGSNDLSNGSGNFTINGTRTITVNGGRLTLGGTQTTVVAGGINKAGAGTLVLLGPGVQTGAATISGGALEAGVMANGGVASSLGQTTNAANQLLMSNATTLRYVGSANATTDRSFTINGTADGHGATIESSGAGTLTYSGGPALAFGTTNQTRSLTLGGTNTGNNDFGKLLINNGTAASSLTKSGVGTWLLSGSNSYTGSTTISGGRLHVASAGRINSTSGVTVNGSGAEFKYNSATAYTQPLTVTQGTVSGTGTISASGGVSIGSNAVISPGNSPGIQSYTTGLTWAQGGSYLWEINDWTGSAGTAYDQVAVTGGALNVTATSGSTFTINITSLSGTASGAVSNWSDTSKTFTIATALSGGGVTNFAANAFTLNSTQFLAQNPGATGTWSISSTGSTVLLNYAPAYASTTYTLGASASVSTIFVGGTSSITATVTNTGTGIADSLGVTGLGVTVSPSGSVTLSPTSGTAANGNGTVVGSGNFTPGAAGSYVFTPTVTSATNVNLGTAASATGTTTTTVTALAHTAPTLTLASGGAQTIITGGTFSPISFNLANPGSNVSALQVGSLSNLTGGTGAGAVAVGGTGSYTVASLPSNVTVGSGSVTVSLSAGDQQSLSGASALQTLGGTTTYTVLEHSSASLAGGPSPVTSTTISLGRWNWQTSTWEIGSGSNSFSLYNLATTTPASLTADLDVTGTSVTGDAGFTSTLTLASYSLIAGGSSADYYASYAPSGTTSGTFTATFTFQTADQNLSGKSAGTPMSVTATVVVVPEPGTIALAGIGIALAGWALARRRK